MIVQCLSFTFYSGLSCYLFDFVYKTEAQTLCVSRGENKKYWLVDHDSQHLTNNYAYSVYISNWSKSLSSDNVWKLIQSVVESTAFCDKMQTLNLVQTQPLPFLLARFQFDIFTLTEGKHCHLLEKSFWKSVPLNGKVRVTYSSSI